MISPIVEHVWSEAGMRGGKKFGARGSKVGVDAVVGIS